MTLEQTITLITLIIGLIGAVAALVPTLIKLFKTVKELVSNKNWATLTQIALGAMKEVEVHYRANPNMSSQAKLDMAIDLIKKSSADLGIEVTDELVDDLVKYIEDTIQWAKDMKK